MSISTTHAAMLDEIKGQGPLYDTHALCKRRPNRGVARAHKAAKRAAAAVRDANTPYSRTKGYRRGMGLIDQAFHVQRYLDANKAA